MINDETRYSDWIRLGCSKVKPFSGPNIFGQIVSCHGYHYKVGHVEYFVRVGDEFLDKYRYEKN